MARGSGLYSDIDKKAKDLLFNDHHSDQKFTTTTCSPTGVVFLHEWWLEKPPHPCKGLAVGGIASTGRGSVFMSTMIVRREEANVLETEDGITIIFRGFINASHASQNGFPPEVCRHFMLGFPHDWKKYSAHFLGDERVDGSAGFRDSNTCSQNRTDDASPFSIRDNDLTKGQDFPLSNNGVLNQCSAPKEVCNGPGNSFGNISKEMESTNDMECNTSMECENGVPDVAAESQARNPETGQSLMGVEDPNSCAGISRKCTFVSPNYTKKMKNDHLSSDCKGKQHIRQKIVEDTSDSCSRRLTRSISKRSHTTLKNVEKDKITSVKCPVRRSPRLNKCR